MLPAIVRNHAERDVDEWSPLRAFRFSDEMHAGLRRRAIGFSCVAPNARTDNVFPGRGAAMIARDDVVEIEIAPVEVLGAVLTGVAVALEDIVPGEFHFLVRQPVEEQQQDYARDSDVKRDRSDDVLAVVAVRKVAPLMEIKRLKITGIFDHDFRMPHVQQHKRALDRADVDRLPKAVEHEHILIERVSHTAVRRVP